ncbi:MAG: hypothetical protein Q7J54_01540 [Candidatus Woesearchaeota archaeon]|nr:hypothetical protein [Candidatus Woesearchaeota archaeon]
MNKTKTFLVIVLFLLNIALVQAAKVQTNDKHYEITLELQNGKLVLDHVYVIGGKAPARVEPEKGYRMEISSFENQILDSFKFSMFGNKTTVRTPYFENGKRIEIFDQNGIRALDVDVGRYANKCGNNICGQDESSSSCLQDCPAKGKVKIKISAFSIIIAAVIAIIAAIFFILERMRNNFFKKLEEKKQLDKNEKLKKYIEGALKKGYKAEQIEKGLIKLGWPKHLVYEIIEDIKNKTKNEPEK